MPDLFRGTGVALVTPFNDKGSVDFNALDGIVDHVINGAVDYLVVMGTTGEAATLSGDERRQVLTAVLEKNAGRLPVVLGFGGNNTRALLDELGSFDFSGVSALLSVCPYYNKPSQTGLQEHYQTLQDQSPLPLILYNVPGRTACNMHSETTLALSKKKNIIGIKEASGDINQISTIIRKRPDDFLVLSGDDALTLPILSLGGDGVISVVANIFPKMFSSMVRMAQNNECPQAAYIHHKLEKIIKLIFADGNPAGVKAALSVLGIAKSYVRLPLTEPSDPIRKSIEREIIKLTNKTMV